MYCSCNPLPRCSLRPWYKISRNKYYVISMDWSEQCRVWSGFSSDHFVSTSIPLGHFPPSPRQAWTSSANGIDSYRTKIQCVGLASIELSRWPFGAILPWCGGVLLEAGKFGQHSRPRRATQRSCLSSPRQDLSAILILRGYALDRWKCSFQPPGGDF